MQKTLNYSALINYGLNDKNKDIILSLKELLSRDLGAILSDNQLTHFLTFFEKLNVSEQGWNDSLFNKLISKIIEKGDPEV